MKLRARTIAGLTLLELIITVGLISLVTLAIGTLMSQMTVQQTRSTALSSLLTAKRILIADLQNSTAIANTIADTLNPSMSCLQGGTPCSGTMPPQTFRLKDALNQVVNDSTDSASGMTLSGAPCKTFNASTGDDTCPLQYQLTWQVVCPTNCIYSQVKITGTVLYKPLNNKTLLPFNGANYGFTFFFNTNHGTTYSVQLSTLQLYHNQVSLPCDMNTPAQLIRTTSACNRFCGNGCGAVTAINNCAQILSGLGYSGGVIESCNPATGVATCVCAP
ncbi:MAG: hypothetical protein P4M08_05880 [Oligoflexia bacterium]|nr:hypothetical protein [Oligoflexia bacterium]